MADQAVALEIAKLKAQEVTKSNKKINKAVNRKFSKTQIVEKPLLLDESDFDAYHRAFRGILRVIVGIIYIPIVLIAGVIEAVEIGFLTGSKKVVSMYGDFLK